MRFRGRARSRWSVVLLSLAWVVLVSGAVSPTSILAQGSETDRALRRLLAEFLAAASHTPASADDKRVFSRFFADDVIYTRSTGVVIAKVDIMKSLDTP